MNNKIKTNRIRISRGSVLFRIYKQEYSINLPIHGFVLGRFLIFYIPSQFYIDPCVSFILNYFDECKAK